MDLKARAPDAGRRLARAGATVYTSDRMGQRPQQTII